MSQRIFIAGVLVGLWVGCGASKSNVLFDAGKPADAQADRGKSEQRLDASPRPEVDASLADRDTASKLALDVAPNLALDTAPKSTPDAAPKPASDAASSSAPDTASRPAPDAASKPATDTAPKSTWPSGKYITVDEVYAHLTAADPSMLLINVVDPQFYNLGFLPGSLKIPWDALAGRVGELDSSRNIVLYCRKGVRSESAYTTLKDKSFPHVWAMEGGIERWIAAGYPTVAQ